MKTFKHAQQFEIVGTERTMVLLGLNMKNKRVFLRCDAQQLALLALKNKLIFGARKQIYFALNEQVLFGFNVSLGGVLL